MNITKQTLVDNLLKSAAGYRFYQGNRLVSDNVTAKAPYLGGDGGESIDWQFTWGDDECVELYLTGAKIRGRSIYWKIYGYGECHIRCLTKSQVRRDKVKRLEREITSLGREIDKIHKAIVCKRIKIIRLERSSTD